MAARFNDGGNWQREQNVQMDVRANNVLRMGILFLVMILSIQKTSPNNSPMCMPLTASK
jgi:hypothetical protein